MHPFFAASYFPDFVCLEECNNELGMRSKRIPDESITSSSILNSDHKPFYARLNGEKAWCSAEEDTSPYIQILLDEEKLITAIKTQGSSFDWSWSRKYEVMYLEKGKWASYNKVKSNHQRCSTATVLSSYSNHDEENCCSSI